MRLSKDDTVGLIYAGGRATRMGGVNKAFVKFEGRCLIEHVVERLRPQCAGIVISANRDLSDFSRLADAVLPDVLSDFPGPLAALDAMARAAMPNCEWVLTVPCDAPRCPADLFERFSAAWCAAEEKPAVLIAEAAGRAQPAFALIHRSVLGGALNYLSKEGNRLGGFLKNCGAMTVDFGDEEGGFINLNSFDECRAAEMKIPLDK